MELYHGKCRIQCCRATVYELKVRISWPHLLQFWPLLFAPQLYGHATLNYWSISMSRFQQIFMNRSMNEQFFIYFLQRHSRICPFYWSTFYCPPLCRTGIVKYKYWIYSIYSRLLYPVWHSKIPLNVFCCIYTWLLRGDLNPTLLQAVHL